MDLRQPPSSFAREAEVSHFSQRQREYKSNKQSKTKKKKKAQRAQQYRDSGSRLNNSTRGRKLDNELDTDTVRQLIADRTRQRDDPSNRELEELLESHQGRVKEQTSRRSGSGGLDESLNSCSVSNTKVPVYGTLRVSQKEHETIRVMSLNVNGLSLWAPNNTKIERLKHVLREYRADVLGLQETNTNFRALKPSLNIASSLRHGDDRIAAVHSHNTRELLNIGNFQAGGTAVVLREELAGLPNVRGVDVTDLGMYSFFRTEPTNGVGTVFVSAYAPCRSEGFGTYYQHIVRYIQSNQLETNPNDLFRRELVQALKVWRANGDRVVLMMDANENVLDGELSKRLAGSDLNMREAVHRIMPGQRGPPTHFRGSDKGNGAIDGIWVSDDIELISACYLPFDSDLGDHRPVVVDLQMRSVLGTSLCRIVPPKARKLNSKVPRVRDKYLQLVRKGFQERKIEQKLSELEASATFPPTAQVVAQMEKLDQMVEEILLHAESKCRNMYPCHFEFSPAIQSWLDKRHLLKWLIRYHGGKQVNMGNMRRFAKRRGLEQWLRAPREEIVELFRSTKEHTRQLLADSPYLRKHFLNEKLNDAIANEREEEAARVKAILRGEAQRKCWQGIKRATKARDVMSVTRVEVLQEDGSLLEHTSKESIEDALKDELRTRFGRATSAPICQGALFDLLGTFADTDAAIDILEGTFVPPPDTDPRTLLIFEEMAAIWSKMGDGEVSISISQDDFQYYWRHVKERTSSSLSGLHFGHYKSIAFDDALSSMMARKCSLSTKTGASPERWSRGLSVMLEKIAGVAVVNKLRAILLLEADFNFCNKLIFGRRMINLARDKGVIPEEIYSSKGKTAEDAILQQTLVYDIARSLRRPLLVAQVDAAQCYDRVALPAASLTLQAFKVPSSAVLSMLRPLHSMEFYLRTGYGQSDSYFGGVEDGKHGLAQGNGAAPPTWQHTSTLILNAHKSKGHGVKLECPLTRQSIQQAGILYVDDTNLWEGLAEDDDLISTAAKGQSSITDWGGFLGATGGALKGEKCGVTIHHQSLDGRGGWVYTDQRNSRQGELDGDTVEENELSSLVFSVPTPTGGTEQIERLPTNKADNNLGLFARPDGRSDQHFEQMRDRITTWTAQIKSGHIPARSVWMSYTCQLWTGLRYGLGACSAPVSELSKAVTSADFYLLSNLGVTRSITKEWRYLPPAFGGMGLYDLTVETTAATLASFLQHFDHTTRPMDESRHLSFTLSVALRHLQLELGVPDCPFNYDFGIWGHLATDSWIKFFWEKLDALGITLEVKWEDMPLPRRGDKAIMHMMVDMGLRGKELLRVNRVRKAQEAFFLSDITTANGKYLEQHLLDGHWIESYERQLGAHRSKLLFGAEFPEAADFKLWKKYLLRVAPSNLLLNDWLGEWINPSPRIWRHFLNTETFAVEIHTDDAIHEYEHDRDSNDRAPVLRAARQLAQPSLNTVPAIIREYDDGAVRVTHRGQPLAPDTGPTVYASFWDRLFSKGGMWMWKELNRQDTEDLTWLVEAIQRGSLFCCTDGSYIRELTTEICGAAWILYCAVTKRSLHGAFTEKSKGAGSYRGEQLGMLAIHILLLTAEEHFELFSPANVCCDNLGTIHTFSRKYARVSSSAKNNDILRVLRKIQSKSKLAPNLSHVKAHQDDRLRYDSLSIEAKLNVFCDKRAKQVLRRAAAAGVDHPATFSLPLESAVVIIDNEKQTADVAKELRYYIGKERARQFYADEGRMSPEIFDSVAWEPLRALLERRPQMFRVWYAKQCSGFCGTGQMITRWDKDASALCPNCGCYETADHLNRCTNKIRRGLLGDSIENVLEWMRDHQTHPDLTLWLPRYLAAQGNRLFVDLPSRYGGKMSQELRQVGTSQDRIGWRHFTEGKVSLKLLQLQQAHLKQRLSSLTIESWTRGFLDQLLSLTHTQWICRNLTKHHRTKGTKVLASRDQIQKEIEHQLSLGTDGLPEAARCLLEIPQETLFAKSTEQQQYWLNAAVASREAAGDPSGGLLEEPLPQAAQLRRGLQVLSSGTGDGVGNRRTQKLASIFNRRARSSGSAPSSTGLAVLPPAIRPQRRDRLELFRRNTDEELRSFSTRDLFRAVPENFSLTFPGGDKVQREALLSLRPPQWLNDEIINTFLRRVLFPKVNHQRVYFFTSFFMSALLQTGEDGQSDPSYNYSNVRSWGSSLRRKDGILGVREIYVPINRGMSHWLLLRADTVSREIKLWDPQGRNESNQIYLQSMRRYLLDKYQDIHGELDEDWAASWTLIDDSLNSPRQSNGHDCGIFLLANATILAQNLPLCASSFSQDEFQLKETRMRVAMLLWLSSTNQPRVPSAARMTGRDSLRAGKRKSGQSGAGKLPLKASKPTSQPSSCKERNKRRRRDKRIIPGGTKTRGKISGADPTPMQQTEALLNRKRSAASIAAGATTLQATTQRHAPPKRKKKTSAT